MSEAYKYKAFISYSHQDARWGKWLHRRLENYPLPKKIVGKMTAVGPVPKRLTPIFRDREELAAADNLGDKIEQALNQSENLIVICSPLAAESHWVNQEILHFKRYNRGAQIFSIIVEGEPFASDIPGREPEECFPPALRYKLGTDGKLSDKPAEPLAADFRPHADGKRLGALKVISGIVGIGLDEIVQRDMRRSRRRVTAITTGALATVIAMGTLTGFALDARYEAEQRRNDAEGLIDFMLTDLRDKLEPVGRLDVLDNVAKEALSYYASQEDGTDCKSSRGEAKAHYLEARISMDRKEFVLADQHAQEALETLFEFTPSCLSNPKFIIAYTHAQQWLAEPVFEKLRDEKRKSKEDSSRKSNLTDRHTKTMWSSVLESYENSEYTLKKLQPFEEWAFEYLIEMTDVDILFAKLFRLNDDHNKSKQRLDSAVKRLSIYFNDEKPTFLMHSLTENDRNRIIDKYADLLTHVSENADDTNDYDLAHSTINKSRKLYESLANPDGDKIINWNAQFGVLGAKYSTAKIYAHENNPSAALNILYHLSEEVSILRNNDQSNTYWQHLEENVNYSIKHLTLE